MQIDFGFCHVAQWRDGGFPKTDNATHVVSHDTRHHAYKIPAECENDFLEWVASVFASDNDPLFGADFAGDVREYLDEIDVSVRAI